MFQTNAQAPLRGVSTPDRPFGFYDSTVDGGWNLHERIERPSAAVLVVARTHVGRTHQSLGASRCATAPTILSPTCVFDWPLSCQISRPTTTKRKCSSAFTD